MFPVMSFTKGFIFMLAVITFGVVGARARASVQTSTKPEPAPAHLLSQLRSKNAEVRRDAANQLGALRSRGALRLLAEALSDRESFVREAAAFALGQISDPAATKLLIPLLAD